MIYAKIASVKSEIGTLTKKSDNPFYKSKYLELSDLLEAVEPLLEKHGLVLLQPIMDERVFSQIIDIEDPKQTIESWLQLPQINDPQKLGSAITYYRRYTLQSLLSLQAVDDDANITVKQTPKAKPVLSAERFQDGLDKVNADKITKEQFIELCGKYELNDTQKKSIELLKKI